MESKIPQLLEEIETYIKSIGFKQEDESLVFSLQRIARQPGPTMVVNGQQTKMPDQEITHTVIVEFFGPGVIEEGTDHEDYFEIIRFKAEDTVSGSKDSRMVEHMEGFYPGELNNFKQMLAKLGI